MICPNCGKEYNEKMTCCISCGADLVPYEKDGEQTAFEPLIPDIPAADAILYAESEPSAAGFVREIAGHSSAPKLEISKKAAEVPSAEEALMTEIPIKSKTSRCSVSGAVKFAGTLTVSLLMLAFILLFSAAAAMRLVTSESRIAEFAENLDVMNFPADEAAIPSEGYNVSEDATVQDAIYAMSQGTGLSRDDIKSIYEASTVKAFIADRLSEYADFIRSGKIPEKLTADSLKGLFSENIGVIDGAMEKPLSQYDINLAFSEIDSVQPVLDRLSPSSLESMLGGGGITALRLLSSIPAAVCAAALAAAMLPLLRTINRSSAAMLRWGGAAALAGGLIVSAAVFLLTIQPFAGFAGCDKLLSAAVKCAADVISPDFYRIGGALAVMGAVMLIWSSTLKKSEKARI